MDRLATQLERKEAQLTLNNSTQRILSLRRSAEERNGVQTATAQELQRLSEIQFSNSKAALLGFRAQPAQSGLFRLGDSARMALVKERQVDPLNLPQHRVKRVPRGPGSPPPPKLSSPHKRLSREEQQAWNVPPCVSNWKNSKGFIIPLEMRLTADGRGQREFKISSNFIKLNAALNAAEAQARTELDQRNKQVREAALDGARRAGKEYQERVSSILREKESLLAPTPAQRSGRGRGESEEGSDSEEGAEERDMLRFAIKKKLERELRQERMGREKRLLIKEAERDIHERLALGKDVPVPVDELATVGEGGVSSGFKDEDVYDLYDKPLFSGQQRVNIYAGANNARLDHDSEDERGIKTDGNQESHKSRVLRTRPIEFQKFVKKD